MMWLVIAFIGIFTLGGLIGFFAGVLAAGSAFADDAMERIEPK